MTLYYSLLKAFLDGNLLTKYKEYIELPYLKENYPELYRLFQCLITLNDAQGSQIYTIEDLELALETYYPNSDRTSFNIIFQKLRETSYSDSSILSYLEQIRKRQLASDVARKALAVAEGREEWNSLKEIVESETANIITPEEDFENDSLEYLQQTQKLTPGLRWRLDSLNGSLGSLRKGDFGFLFARPETGKTTFLASECTHMATQANAPIIWIDNEEQGGKVLLRCYQASLGVTSEQLFSNINGHEHVYKQATKGNLKLVYDVNASKGRVELLCRTYRPSLLILDQIDHIKGFSGDARNDIELKNIYTWARGLAALYCPVIAVCQAGATGDGKRWLTMNDVDNSKTGKQGSADWILGIGKDYDEGHEGIRYMHLSKNKLLGDPDTKTDRRHDRWEVRIHPDIARYEDF